MAALWLMRVLGRSQRADLTRSPGGNGLTSAGHRLVNAGFALCAKLNPAHAGLTLAELAAGAVVLAVVGSAAWRIDLEINPFKPCPRCKGSGHGRFSRKGAFNLCLHRQRPRAFAKGAAARHDARRRS